MSTAGKQQVEFPWPLEWRVSPVQAFVEIPILGHSRYTSIEIQRLVNANGTGLIAIVHRKDETVDVYFESVLALDDSWRHFDPAVSHMRAGVQQAVTFETGTLDIGVDSIDCNVSFYDEDQCLVQLQIAQKRGRGSRVRQFVPMPANATASVLRLLLLDCFCMVRRRGTTINIRVGEEDCIPATFALPIGFSKRYSGRFSSPVLLVGLNPNGHYQPNRPKDFKLNDVGSLVSARVGRDDFWFEMEFEPALPLPDSLLANDTYEGLMTIRSPLGVVTQANWVLRRGPSDTSPELSLRNVNQNWFPSFWGQPTLSVLARLRSFKRRGVRLAWTGRLLGKPGEPTMQSTWTTDGHWQEQSLVSPRL